MFNRNVYVPKHPVRAALTSRFLVLVAIGSAMGALLRWALTALPAVGEFSMTGTLVANLLGALFLGTVLERFCEPVRRTWMMDVRILLGSGMCAGLTTYSTFALEVLRLSTHTVIGAASYAVGTIVGGCLAAWVGFGLGSRWHQAGVRS